MPIEIRELVVRARVDAGAERPAPTEIGGRSAAPRESEIVQTCVREVLRILEEKRER